MGDPASTTYPKCTHAGCTAATNRTVSPAYTNGWLTAVPGYASAITYHPNGQVNQVTRLNSVVDTYAKDPYHMARPNQVSAMLGTTVVWNGGVHAYDGAGNLTRAGNAYFLYDAASRIKGGLLYLGAGAGGTTATFDHAYDGFGNLQSLTANGVLRNTLTAATTNRLTGSVTYDAAGNLTYWNGASYSYDRFNSMGRMVSGTEDWLYMYTADDERIWSFKVAGNTSRWTLRDLDGKVLREYQNLAGTWSVQRDYVYRGSQILAAHTPDASPKNLVQFHLDHLGTPRAVTNTNGARIAYHVYYPFGEEATGFSQDTERMKFTGHERDFGNLSSAADDLDYMHARFHNPQTGRFGAVDPLGGPPSNPQSWNRYTYALNNPLKYIDPLGLFPCPGIEDLECQEEITITGEDPGPGYNPLTGVQGLDELIGGWRSYSQAGNGAIEDLGRRLRENYPRLNSFMEQVGQAVNLAMISGIGPPVGKAPGLTSKILRQMPRRGWTAQMIDEAVTAGQKTQAVNKATGNPATRYVHPRTGQSVVIDNITGEVIHVGAPGFRYGPTSGDL